MRATKSDSIASACDRLVHPSVAAAGRRGRQGRFVGLMLAGPFLAGVAAAPVAAALLGTGSALLLTCVLLSVGWLVALAVATSGKSGLAERLMLVVGAGGLAGLIAAAGGLASPYAVLFAALPIETRWVTGTRKGEIVGLAAGALVFLLSMLLETTVFGEAGAAPSVWQWLLPLAYGATLWLRLGNPRRDEDDGEADLPARLEDVTEAVVLRMSTTGEVASASPQARDMLGVAADMLLGTAFFERVHIGDRVPYLSALADLRRGAVRRHVELRLRQAAGGADGAASYRPFLAEIVTDESGGGLIACLRDDTRAAGLKTALAAESERLHASEIRRARMLGAVSHELRTPLNAILGFSDVLGQEMFGSLRNARQAEYVELIHDAGEHLLSVVNALLDLSKMESGALELCPEAFSFDDAALLCVSMIARQADAKGVRMETSGCATGVIHCDRRALQQILINLLSNAVKFTPQGGRVTVNARRHDGRLDFEVIDTGIGMARDDLERVGTPFVRIVNDAAPVCDGTGLGLSLVKGLVELQHGTMTIESAPDAGTCVRISLPVAAPLAAAGESMPDGVDANEEDGRKDVLRKAG